MTVKIICKSLYFGILNHNYETETIDYDCKSQLRLKWPIKLK